MLKQLKKSLLPVSVIALLAIPAALATYTPILTVLQGGTGATTASDARTNLSAAKSGANSDITSLSGLTTALSAPQGGTGYASYTGGDLIYAGSSSAFTKLSVGASPDGNVLTLASGVPSWAAPSSNQAVTPVTTTGTAALGFDKCDATSAPIILTLPVTPVTGAVVIAKKIDTSANAVTVTKGLGSLIDGATTYVLAAQYDAVSVVYDGTNWNVE
jgi:hypothetical protein